MTKPGEGTSVPGPPLPFRAMAVAKRVLPSSVYYRYLGRHERGSLSVWRRLVDRAPVDSSILDVGAYHGLYALAARERRSDVEVVAFEPNQEALATLRAACAGRSIATEGLAVAAVTGSVSFSLDGESSGIVAADHEGDGVQLAAVSLDDWTDAHGADPWLLKVDVEGGEDGVLTGGRRVMARARPIVLCEVLDDEAGRRVQRALPEGYRYFRIDEDRGLRHEQTIERRAWRHKNHLLVPAEHASMVQDAVAGG